MGTQQSDYTTLDYLRTKAFEYRHMDSAFEWLRTIGLVPEGVTRMNIRQVLTELDPEKVSVSYIAASAYEWDTWGPASPVDFIKAISAEAKGAQGDLILSVLRSLGREQREEVAA